MKWKQCKKNEEENIASGKKTGTDYLRELS